MLILLRQTSVTHGGDFCGIWDLKPAEFGLNIGDPGSAHVKIDLVRRAFTSFHKNFEQNSMPTKIKKPKSLSKKLIVLVGRVGVEATAR
jgi:hypothetical protein